MLEVKMNYRKIYHLLIEKADSRCILPSEYKERHHIIPKCMGGDNSNENLIDLLPEEHFVSHQLLAKIYPKNHKLLFACNMMLISSPGQSRNNKNYKWLKQKISIGLSKLHKGKKLSEETKKKMRKPKSEEHKMKIGLANKNKKDLQKTLGKTVIRIKIGLVLEIQTAIHLESQFMTQDISLVN